MAEAHQGISHQKSMKYRSPLRLQKIIRDKNQNPGRKAIRKQQRTLAKIKIRPARRTLK